MCNFITISEWANANYELYKTKQGLTPYYAKCKQTSKFYLLDFGIGDEKCKELKYEKYLDLELKKELINIDAKEINEVLLKEFFGYMNKQED